ncbi:MAG: segregation/condensation protein A [Kiritimatiellae bacterium]|nr:segregation/condensation protein A [Kiritimatiellia bacterium]MDW8458403.1 segregation/condensation protein A [Verrucomicrobiota bacterium]
MTTREEYHVRLDVFEGPLDLLLYLIKRDELDIYNIPIEHITRQYMQYLEAMQMLDLNIAGEFLVMAATLMLIKSRMLLPVEERPELEADEEDPRWDLVRQLLEYKKFKDAALHLEKLALQREDVFAREGEHVELGPAPDVALRDVSIFDLISAFTEALKKAPNENVAEIFQEQYTVAEKIDELSRLMKERPSLQLGELLGRMRSRYEMICTFLAVLELIRLKVIRARQEHAFGEIELVAADAA